MSIHSRRAASAVLDRIEAFPLAGTPILHWFSGSNKDLDRAIESGCWFSVGPAMLAGERGRRLTSRMPRERILTESDGPFARVDGVSLNPWDVGLAERALAEVWDVSKEKVSDVLRSNLKTLIKKAL